MAMPIAEAPAWPSLHTGRPPRLADTAPSRPQVGLRGLPGLCAPWMQALAEEGFATLPVAAAGSEVAACVMCIDGPVALALADLRRWQAGHLPQPPQPLLVITAQARALDQVLLLEMGADDVLAADTPPALVAAKLRRLLARLPVSAALASQGGGSASNASPQQLWCGVLCLRLAERSARCGEQRLPLTEGEFEVLWLLALQPGQPVSRAELLQRARGLAWQRFDRAIDSRIYRLRRKLLAAGPGLPQVRTLRHQGYALVTVD